jgi:hypothetical protein
MIAALFSVIILRLIKIIQFQEIYKFILRAYETMSAVFLQ